MAVDSQWNDVVLFLPCDGSNIDDYAGNLYDQSYAAANLPVLSSTQSLTGGKSLYYDGGDRRLKYPSYSWGGQSIQGLLPPWDFSEGNFEISFAIYPTSIGWSAGEWCLLFIVGGINTSFGLSIGIEGNGSLEVGIPRPLTGTRCATSSGVVTTGSGGTFQKFEVSCSSGTVRIFKDGSLVGGPTAITLPVPGYTTDLYVGYDNNASYAYLSKRYTGYLDRVRITKSPRHSSGFSDDGSAFPFPSISGVIKDNFGDGIARTVLVTDRVTGRPAGGAVSTAGTGAYSVRLASFNDVEVRRIDEVCDPLWAFRRLVLNFVGTEGSTNIVDGHGRPFIGDGTQPYISTAQSPFAGGSSLYCPGAAGGSIKCEHEDFQLMTDFWKIEAWAYPISGGHGASGSKIIKIGPFQSRGDFYIGSDSTSSPMVTRTRWCDSAYTDLTTYGGSISNNAWHFIELYRWGGQCVLFADGTKLGYGTPMPLLINHKRLCVGGRDATDQFKGYIGPIRITVYPDGKLMSLPTGSPSEIFPVGPVSSSSENILIYDRVTPGF